MQWTDERVELIISGLEGKIEKLEEELFQEKEETFSIYKFMTTPGREKILVEWIEHCYREHPEYAKKMVAVYHDETIDMSTIDCCKNDFNPWEA